MYLLKDELNLDSSFMRRAIELAQEAARADETPVGAVVVLDGKIIGEGRNRREHSGSATAHAEIEAIEQACKNVGGWRLCGCDLYVTLEPCPMCAGAAINSRIQRVIFGASDPKAGSCGSLVDLFSLPYNHRPEIISGVLSEECGSLLTEFFRRLRQKSN